MLNEASASSACRESPGSPTRPALVVIAVVGIWVGLGTQIVIFPAGLQGIPDTLIEAAELDGAGPVRNSSR